MENNKNLICVDGIEPVAQSGQSTSLIKPSDSSPLSISFEQLLDMPVGNIVENFENQFNSLAKAHAVFTKNNGAADFNNSAFESPNYAEQLIDEVENGN